MLIPSLVLTVLIISWISQIRAQRLRRAAADAAYRLNVDRINRNAFYPSILHNTSDLKSRLVRDQRTDQVQSGIQTSSDSARGDDTHTPEGHGCTSSDGLATARVPPGIAALASD